MVWGQNFFLNAMNWPREMFPRNSFRLVFAQLVVSESGRASPGKVFTWNHQMWPGCQMAYYAHLSQQRLCYKGSSYHSNPPKRRAFFTLYSGPRREYSFAINIQG